MDETIRNFIVGNGFEHDGTAWISKDKKSRLIIIKNKLRFDIRSNLKNWKRFKSSYIADIKN